ncbi:YncE family protein [Nocardioides ganghwensis]|uniref:Uncharacterized protein n=1 Tax=Nocardioides ganghwensis TaxID=252230 RepID=A0A4Q2S5P4_9ACTN|nr:hypothetical protein [Nocardioides ganghwensis]MBD3947996.1 hypothetical protein [Nocardioides ganghwensis]RYB97428.1 hypothetical protein EUA07_20125 [Nocardioides ganghwensis]
MGVGIGPEPVHAEMTSGSSGTIRSVGTDTTEALAKVRESIELIRYAQDRPSWDSDAARRSYNMRAWATRASAEICVNRLNRVTLALEVAADGYDHMVGQADEVIRWYRREKPQAVDALGMYLLMFTAVNNLGIVRGYYTDDLDTARDFLETDPFSTDEEDWAELGLVKSMLRDLEHGTMPGPVIPETFGTGQDDRAWTPQGLGLTPDGNLIQTSYEEVTDPATGDKTYLANLSIIDPDTGEVLNTVELGGGDGLPPNHAGGVVVHDGTVWVASSDSENPTMVPYSLSQLSAATPTETVQPSGPPISVGAGASATVSGDTMYVGSFNEHGPGKMYIYTWDPDTKTWGDKQGPVEIPPKTQGIAVRGNEIVFSTSYGRDRTSELQSYNLADITGGGSLPDPLRTVDLPTMSEGLVMLPGGIATTHESGASPYASPNGKDPADLWAGMFLTLTPYDELGLSGQVDVVPATLQAASAWFADAERGLDQAQKRVARLNLPPSSLGVAPGAGALVTAVDTYVDTTATWIEKSRLSSDTTASGLIAAANDYEDADSRSDGLFGFLQRFVS